MPATSAGGRTVRVTLAANVDGFVAAMAKARNAAEQVAGKSQTSQWRDLSSTMVRAGAVAAAGIGVVVKAAMGWESAFAGVRKTVDGTSEQMAELEASLRGMATSMPATHKEIAAVAEAAGQLGIARDDVAAFTKTMIQLGETTNLSADTAATSLAQFMNIMGTSTSEVDRLGSALVALGNDGASTEADVMALSLRLAGTAKQMGITEHQTMAVANAMASVGIEAEAGGTAMSLSWKAIDAHVRQGGKSLEKLAQISGMTAAEFQQAWKNDAAEATDAFIRGLGKMGEAGEDINKVLADLGFEGIRQTDTLLRLAGASDLLTASLALGAEAYADNSALAEEYAKRAATAEAQVTVAWNGIKDAAITFGEAALPIVSQAAAAVAELAAKFADMPEGVQHFGLGALAVVAAGGLMIGALGKVVSSVAGVHQALVGLGLSAQSATLRMGAIGLAVTAAAAVLSIWIGKQAEAKAATDQLTDAMRQQGDAVGDLSNEMVIQQLQQKGALDAADALGISYQTLTDAAHGNAEAMDEVMSRTQGAIIEWERGEAATNELYNAARTLNDVLPDQAEHVANAAAAWEQENAAKQTSVSYSDLVRQAIEQENAALAAQSEQMQSTIDSIRELNNQYTMLTGTSVAAEAAIDNMTASIEQNGLTLDHDTEAGRANQLAYNDLINTSTNYIATLVEQQGETAHSTAEANRLGDAIYQTGIDMGLPIEEAERLANNVRNIPKTVGINVDVHGADRAKAQLDALAYARRVDYYVNIINSGYTPTAGFGVVPRAQGGVIRGPGTATSDSILMAASNGEYVVRTYAAEKIGYDRLDYINRYGELPRFADGGRVAVPSQSPHAQRVNYQPITIGRSSGEQDRGTNITIGQIVNPIAEPTTVTASRQLQRAASLTGGLV